jgi:hypothetical protein
MHGPRLLGALELPIHQTQQSEVGQGFEKMQCGHILVKMSRTPILASMDCPAPSSISCDVKKLWESQAITIQWQITISSSSISSNISSSLEVEVK